MPRNDAQTSVSITTDDTHSDLHPHEPDIPRALNDEGRCLVCALTTEKDQRIEALARKVQQAQTERDEWRALKQPDTEAEAIAGCVKALDVFVDRSSSYGSNTWTVTTGNTNAIGRVLRFLASRYGADLAPNVQVLCQHETPTDDLTRALEASGWRKDYR